MSRPKEFDRAEALAAAKVVFWKKGYDATTTDYLRHAMKIGRQSLYDSFGGKRPLYLEVLQRYNTESVIAQITRLRAAKSPLVGIRNLLLALAEEPEKRRKLGCMGSRLSAHSATRILRLRRLAMPVAWCWDPPWRKLCIRPRKWAKQSHLWTSEPSPISFNPPWWA